MKFLSIAVLLLIGTVAGIAATGCSSFGSHTTKEDRTRFESSSQFNREKGTFQNRLPHLYDEMLKRFEWRDYWESLRPGVDRIPSEKFASTKPDLDIFLRPSENPRVIWLGHSSLLLNIGGKIVLIDPVFAESAAPYSFLIRRFQPSPLTLTELPPIDYIVISHDHYDHLDMEVAHFFKNKNTGYIVPLGVGTHLRGWGVSYSKIVELDWWQNFSTDGLEFVATPAQHSSGRSAFKLNETLWASWVIRNEKHAVYFSGDSGYDTHFKEIGKKYGPFDIAFMETGQYNVKWQAMHLLPDEAIQAFNDINAKAYFPIHWGMFSLAWHPWHEPIVKVSKTALEKKIRLVSPQLGQIVEVDDGRIYDPWWERLLQPQMK